MTISTEKELTAIHIPIAELLEVSCSPDWIYTHIPNGEYRPKPIAAKLKRMGVKPGWPDFIFLGSRFRKPPKSDEHIPGIACLELKRKSGKLNSHQEEFKKWTIEELGCSYCVTDDIGGAIKFLKDLGIINVK